MVLAVREASFFAGVQVIDARDPLTYRSNDLEQYARDIAQHKGSLLLLNKADLLSAELRTAWADYFDEQGVSYVFWSAKAAADALKQDTGASLMSVLCEQQQDVPNCAKAFSCPHSHLTTYACAITGRRQPPQPSAVDPRARVLSSDELMAIFQQKAQEAYDKATPEYLELRVPVYMNPAYLMFCSVLCQVSEGARARGQGCRCLEQADGLQRSCKRLRSFCLIDLGWLRRTRARIQAAWWLA